MTSSSETESAGRGGSVSIRPEIALSWKRSALSGVDPGREFDATPADDLDLTGRLLRAARPVLDEVGIQIAGTELCVLLADPDCRIVASVFDNPAVARRMERLGAIVGSRFGEDRAGTNALGTPLEVRRGVAVNGPEHYLEQFKELSCYGHPIIHPVTRRVEGILDLTCIAPQVNSLFAPFLQRAAADIERRLLEGSRASEQRLVDAFHRVSPQRHVAVAAISEDLLLSNRTAQEMLDGADHAVLRGLAADLQPNQSRTVRIELASGESVTVQADRIAGADGGALFLVQPTSRRSVPIPRGSTRPESAGTRTSRKLQRLRHTDDAVLVLGEPGSGRTSAARDIADDRCTHSLDAAHIAVRGLDAWVAELGTHLQGRAADGVSPDVLVVEQVQLLPESVHPLLAGALAGTGPRIVLTACPEPDLPRPVAALVARCPERVVLPPLRQRRAELPDIAQVMLDEIAPGARLTASAIEALGAAQWPGNLAELTVVLDKAVARARAAKSAADGAARDPSRSVGNRAPLRITVADLPARCRTSDRVTRLGGRERAERQAIVDALTECGGNKVHAAAQLGISRSTLYTRMRALDITR
ncbi:sigma-54-dependent Fis family transcriptional regulator [Rhodococcus sp. NPDC003318]|uniref:sigma-54-dependent Fis family transcriptional regulator n=1 Tax=Rhodococcus sp. NPDC003318 TaxID=3364503 RepID=UPI0036CCCD1C